MPCLRVPVTKQLGQVNCALAHVYSCSQLNGNEASSWASRYHYASAPFVDSRLGCFLEYGRVGRGLALGEHQPLGPLELGHIRRRFGAGISGFKGCSLTSLLGKLKRSICWLKRLDRNPEADPESRDGRRTVRYDIVRAVAIRAIPMRGADVFENKKRALDTTD